MTRFDAVQVRRQIQRAVKEQRWSEACGLLESWTRRFPNQPKAWSLRARCILRIGDLETALDCARRASALAPSEESHLELVRHLENALAAPAAGPAATLVEHPAGDDDRPPTSRESPTPTLVDEPDVRSLTPSGVPPATIVDPSPGVEPTAVDGGSATLREPSMAEAGPGSGLPADRWSEGTVVDGRYEVRGATRGGMGKVFFVHDRELGLDIAVKTPLASSMRTEAGRLRFLREAEAWVALGLHPNICTAYYVREIDGVPRLFIEFVDGGNLEEWLAGHPVLSPADRLDLAIQIAAGMEHAHTFLWHDEDGEEHRGLVHRDLKPANVLVGSDGRARVTDFGLVGRDVGGGIEIGTAAAVVEPRRRAGEDGDDLRTGSIWGTMTMAGGVFGSPRYMAPEQWDGAHLAGRPADVYAFGCILYELICGRHALQVDERYRGADAQVRLMAWEQMHRTGEPADPRALVSDLDDQLAAIMHACLDKVADRRPASFNQLGIALRDAYARIAGREYPRPPATHQALPADSLNNRGVSFASLGQLQRAERAWREAVSADPQHLQATFNLALFGWWHRSATDREVVNRMADMRRAPTRTWRHDLLAGRALLLLGRYREALESLQASFEAAGDAPEAARDLGLALCAAASEGGPSDLWQRTAALLSTRAASLRNDPAMLACYSLAARRLHQEETSRRLWAEASRWLQDPPATLDLGAARLLPGAQLVRRIDLRLGRILSIGVDPTGSIAALGTDSGALAVIDTDSGRARTLRGQGARIRCTAAVAPAGKILSWEENESIACWNLDTGDRRSFHGHTGHLNSLGTTADGALAVAASSAGTIVVWDVSTGRRLSVVKTHSGFSTCASLTADGSVAVSGGNDGTLVVVEIGSERPVATFAAHSGGVSSVAMSADGRRALSGGSDGNCVLWDIARQTMVAELAGHAAAVTFVALSEDSTRAVSGSADGTLRMWELPSGRPIMSQRLPGAVVAGSASTDWAIVAVAHGVTVSTYSLKEVPAYRPGWAVSHLVTSSEVEERARLYKDLLARTSHLTEKGDFATARIELDRAREIPGYARAPETLRAMAEVNALFPRKELADGWEDGLLRGHGDAVMAIAVAPLGDRAASCGRDRRLVIWDIENARETGDLKLPMIPLAACFVGDRDMVATADLDNVVRLWDLAADWSPVQLQGHETRINAMAGEPTGRWLLTCSADGTARVWDAAAGTCRHVLAGHLGAVTGCAINPDGRSAATGGDDGVILGWDISSGREAGAFEGHSTAIRHLDWSAEGRYLLSVAEDETRLWDVRSRRCLRTLEAAGGPPTCAVLSPDSRFAAIVDVGGAARLWSLRDRRVERIFEGHTGAVLSAAFTRDGRRLLTAGADGSVRVWYLEWEHEQRGFVEWDESARPHLEVFIAQHSPVQGGPPSWSDGDVRRLLSDLRHRGLGWIRPDGIRSKLDQLGKSPQGRAPAPLARAMRRRRPDASPRSREKRRTLRIRVVAAALIGIPLLLLSGYLWGRSQLRLDSRQARELRSQNLAVLMQPMITTRSASCDRARLDDYLRDLIGPTDVLADWAAANYCLMVLADPRSVEPVLGLVRAPPQGSGEPEGPESLIGIRIGADRRQVMNMVRSAMSGGLDTEGMVKSLLARMGDPVVDTLVGLLDDPDDNVREIVAGALALAGTERSIASLTRRSTDSNPSIRRAVARQISNLAISDKLELADAFRIAESMSRDDDPTVRRIVADEIGIFAGANVRRLARRLARDSDPRVREAARSHIH